MKHNLETKYEPSLIEASLYSFWKENNYFHAEIDESKEPYTIVIPPPNVTGVLHMGHGLNNILQDILIRYNRMLGKPTLWVPGTDHAGIATQNVVERMLKKEGKTKHDLGREEFIKKTWEVKESHHKIITAQLEKIGCSTDWERERFTLDDGLTEAVREIFVNLYNDGLIYRGKYLINYCTSCGTALANDEVEHEETDGCLYRIRYQIEGTNNYIEVDTSRPETIFADVAIAVNPDDERYNHLDDNTVIILPIVGRKLKLVRDSHVDIEFGTGALKITPAHAMNDFIIAEKNNLEIINILNPDGTFNENVPEKYRGRTIEDVKNSMENDLKEVNAFIGKNAIKHQVGHCYRCHNPVEPYYSDQWFVKMKPLADMAYKAVEDKEINIYPERWTNTYNYWLNGIKDWCISRQLWWGHRIPVWYCDDCSNIMASKTDVTFCDKCKSENIRQDEDVLDTWFSSWLWPFSTLGWPHKTKELDYFYPTTTLVTGYDILFFWVARMIMAGLYTMKKPPFKNVYLNGLIRDKTGRKMSKSLGNGVDPIDIVDEHGADSLRFTLSFITSLGGQDIWLDRELFKMGAKFSNKIYNSAKFIFSNIDNFSDIKELDSIYGELENKDKWIITRLENTIKELRKNLDEFRFDEASQTIYKFYWNDFCDWYIEMSKPDLKSDIKKINTLSVLVYVLKNSCKLLHPFLPFITEHIYQNINENEEIKSIMMSEYPKFNEAYYNEKIEHNFETAQNIISKIRNAKASFNIPLNKKLDVFIHYTNDEFMNVAKSYQDTIKYLSSTDNFTIVSISESKREQGYFVRVFEGGELCINLAGVIDIEKEKQRLMKEKLQYEKELEIVNKKLQNENFVTRASTEAVDTEKRKQKEFSEKLSSVLEVISSL